MERGDRVHVTSIGTGTIRDVRNGGRYLVEIKGRSIVVSGSELKLADPPKSRRAKPPAPTPQSPADMRVASIDLHGKTTMEAVDALDAVLNDVLMAGGSVLHVIHGRSGGRVKAAVHRRLKEVAAVHAFRVDPRNPGVTIVTL